MEQEPDNKILSPLAEPDRTEPDMSGYTLTVEEVAELFAEAGVPRNPRSIRRFCQNDELDCMTIETPTSARYLVRKTSVEKLIKQKQQALQFSESRTAPAMTGHSRIDPDMSGHNHTPQPQPEPPRETDDRADVGTVKRLEDELVNLRIDNRAKEQVITMLRDERREMQTQLNDVSYRLGAAETRVAQLEAPKTYNDEEQQTEPDRATERIKAIIMPARSENMPPPDPEPPQPEQRRSFFGRLFR
jgi:hypothetical protein